MSIAKMTELIEKLNTASYKYYVLDSPIISDVQWDKLYDELQDIEKNTGIVLPNSPSLRVGGEPLKSFNQHRHINKLYSMDKVQNTNDLLAWFNKNKQLVDGYNKLNSNKLDKLEYVVEYKLDGLTLNLTYDNGFLIQASTRGNGEIGEAVLSQAKTIKSIPLKIDYEDLIEIQGECLMRLSVFETYNENNDDKLKNARNAAAGGLRNLNPQVTAKRNLSAYFYNINHIKGNNILNQEDLFNFLKTNQLPISPFYKKTSNIDDILQLITDIEATRHNLDFLIDGIVIKVNDLYTREIIGYTEKFPKWCMAYKFEAEEYITKLKNVVWDVGRTGKVTPLAYLEPVDFNGVTVSRATLNNYGDIVRKKLAINCDVWIRRSNDVIPEIIGRANSAPFKNEILIEEPKYCPYCKSILEHNGANLFCFANDDCKPQAVARIDHFASRDAMNIEGLSTKTIEQMYDTLGVRNIADIYSLDLEKILTLNGFKNKKAEKILKSINNSKSPTFDNFLFGIGIANIGKKTAKDISKVFKSIDKLKKATTNDLLQISEFGLIMANSIKNYFNNEYNIAILKKLAEFNIKPIEQKDTNDKLILNNLSFVITGTLEKYTRKEIEDFIEELGGQVSSSISKNTSYLIYGNNPGSKLNKAKALDIKMINEQEFANIINRE